MEKKNLIVSEQIRSACPDFVGGALYAEFTNSEYCEELWNEIRVKAGELKMRQTVDTIKHISGMRLRAGYIRRVARIRRAIVRRTNNLCAAFCRVRNYGP